MERILRRKFQHVCHLNNTSGLNGTFNIFQGNFRTVKNLCIKVKYIFVYIKLHNGAQKVWELYYPESQGREETPDSSMNISDAEQGSDPRREPEGTSARPDPNLPSAPSACPGHSGRPAPSRYRQMRWAPWSEVTNHMCIFSSGKFSCNNLQPQTWKHLRLILIQPERLSAGVGRNMFKWM